MSPYIPLIFLWVVIIMMYRKRKKDRKNRRRKRSHERTMHMNELIQNFIGKRCEIQGDVEVYTAVTIKSAEGDWILVEDDKGKQSILNTNYISGIREAAEKKKKA